MQLAYNYCEEQAILQPASVSLLLALGTSSSVSNIGLLTIEIIHCILSSSM